MDHNQLHPSPNDQRKYKYLNLSNELSVLLISDETTDKASCCCDVHIGSLSDPTTAQGLAHFLEHMLFMGTEAYPDENAYQAFLASHNGYSNAYTDLESTVYYFDVQSDHLEHALDMFASFFTTPLFNESSVDREINAVDSENAKNLQSDMWRSYQLMKSLAKTNHPYSKFSTGNLKTLKESVELQQLNIRELLLDFYQTYYSANLMKVCVYGKEDLQTLESWVVNKFSSIPNKQLTCPIFDSNPYGENELKTFVQMVPIRDKIELNIEFPLFSMNKFYLSKPDDYITSLLGHESEGSILHALKTVGYANSLSSYVNSNCKDFAFVCIDIELSELGSNYVNEVIECVFAYIHMLNKEGCQLWYAQELKDIHDLKYKFLEKSQPSDYVTKLANNMQIYEPKDTLVSTYTIQSIDLSTVPEIINKLIPENCIILYKNKKLITNKIESWYGTNYSDHKFSSEQMQLWNAALQGLSHWEVYMPKPNPFIPNEFAIRCESLSFETIDNMKNIQLIAKSDIGIMLDESIYCDENEVSIASVDMKDKEAIKESDVVDEDEEEEDKEDEEVEQEDKNVSGANGLMKLFHGKIGHTWFKMDLEWKVPKLNVIILLESNISSSSPYGVAMTDLFGHVLKEKLSSFSYYADVSGLHYDIRLAKGGLELMFFGYHNKLSVLVLKTIEELKSCLLIDNITNELFHRMKEKVLRSYYNSLFWQPYYHAIHGTSYCLEDPRWSNAEKQNAIFDISLIDFISFIRQFIRYLKIEILIHGNATINEAKVFSNDIINCLETLPLSSNQEPIRRVIHLDIAKEYIYRQHAKHFNINEMNSAIENLYFIGLMTLKSYNQQVDMKGLKNEAYLNLLVQLVSINSMI